MTASVRRNVVVLLLVALVASGCQYTGNRGSRVAFWGDSIGACSSRADDVVSVARAATRSSCGVGSDATCRTALS